MKHSYLHRDVGRGWGGGRVCGGVGGMGVCGSLTFHMVQTSSCNCYDPTYLYTCILQISNIFLFVIFVCKKAPYSYTTIRISLIDCVGV